MKTEQLENSTKQTADEGFVLQNNESFSREVYIPIGNPLWNEIPDTGQLDIVLPKEATE